MEDKRVIPYKRMPARPGSIVWMMIVIYLLLEHEGAAGWAYGASFAILAFLLLANFYALWNQKQKDVYPQEKEKP